MKTLLFSLRSAKCFRHAGAEQAAAVCRFGLAVLVAIPVFAGMAGCGMASNASGTTAGTVAGSGAVVTGKVHGGQQPVVGAQIRLYAVGTGGYGGSATSLLNAPGYVTTDSSGNFNITGLYNCSSSPLNTTPAYVTATGGNAGGGSNSAINLVAAVGLCGSLTSSTTIFVDEVSTVAAAYALSGFASSVSQISTSGTTAAKTAIANAFLTITNLVGLSSGNANTVTVSGSGTVPQATLNTLANILAACVNSNLTTQPMVCQTLYSAATPPGGTAPTDTFQAAIKIAQNPGNNVSALFNLATPASPFQPSLNVAPNDFTVSITYAGGGIATPQALAVDASGNVWIVNSSKSVTQIAAGTGAFASGASGYTGLGLDAPSGVAVDTTGNIWISNCGDSCSGSGNPAFITELTSAGTAVSGSPYRGGGLSGSYAIALDGSNAAWVSNVYSNSISKFSSSGAAISGTAGFSGGGLSSPLSAAIDSNGNAWSVDPVVNSVSELTQSGAAASGSPFTGAGIAYPEALAIDHANNIWVASHDGNVLAELNNSGTVLSGTSGISGGGISQPNSVAIDGAGNVYVANGTSSGGISEVSNARLVLSPSTGYISSGMIYPNGVAIDGAGNAWVTGCGSYCSGSGSNTGSVTEFVGLATPVVTPLSTAVSSNLLGSKP